MMFTLMTPQSSGLLDGVHGELTSLSIIKFWNSYLYYVTDTTAAYELSIIIKI